jgi:hypothetical protein
MEPFLLDLGTDIGGIPQLYQELDCLGTCSSYETTLVDFIRIKKEKNTSPLLTTNNPDTVLENFFAEYDKQDPISDVCFDEYETFDDDKTKENIQDTNNQVETVPAKSVHTTQSKENNSNASDDDINNTNDLIIWYSHTRNNIFVIKKNYKENNKSIRKKKCMGKFFDITDLLTMKQKDVANLLGMHKASLCKKFKMTTNRRWPYREHKKILRSIKIKKKNKKSYIRRINYLLAPAIIKL